MKTRNKLHLIPALFGGLLLAAGGAFAAPQVTSQPPAPAPQAAPAPAPETVDPLATARRITVADARQALAKGEAVLVDVRSPEAYEAEHAQGAIVIPLSEIPRRAGELPKDKLIITYCT